MYKIIKFTYNYLDLIKKVEKFSRFVWLIGYNMVKSYMFEASSSNRLEKVRNQFGTLKASLVKKGGIYESSN